MRVAVETRRARIADEGHGTPTVRHEHDVYVGLDGSTAKRSETLTGSCDYGFAARREGRLRPAAPSVCRVSPLVVRRSGPGGRCDLDSFGDVLVRSERRKPGFELVISSSEDSGFASGDAGEVGSQRCVRSCRRNAELDTWRRQYSVREAQGQERAAAVVHPIKASSRTQHRVDRTRSWREYSTHTVLGSRVAHSEVHANALRGC